MATARRPSSSRTVWSKQSWPLLGISRTGRAGEDHPRWSEIFHRYLTPVWAFLPTSGAGAAVDGGRFNRSGIEALYLSRSAPTVLDEYRQRASITPPATLAAYKIALAEMADLSQGFDRTSGTAPGKDGMVLSARSLVSTERSHHHGSLRT